MWELSQEQRRLTVESHCCVQLFAASISRLFPISIAVVSDMDPSHQSFPEEAQLVEFSAAFDQYGPSSELTEIADGLGLSSDQQQRLIADWQQTSLRLNRIPVANARVADAVMSRIAADTRRPAVRPAGPKRRRQLAKIVALATSSVAMLYVSLQVATHEQSLNRSAEVLASFSFDPQGWDVVVVTVSAEQADQLSRDFGQPSASGNLKMLSLLENQDSEADSIGVMIASKETSEKLLVKFGEASSHGDAQWNPKMVGELGRDELLKRFAISMKTPTKSDMFFREVIVVTSDDDSGFHVTSRAADLVASRAVIASTAGADSGEDADREAFNRQQEGESMLMQMQNNRQRPVLVVLKRRSEPAADSQGNISPRQPSFAAYL